MTEHRVFNVGGHIFALDFPIGMLSEKELRQYAPFQTDSFPAIKAGSDYVDDILFSLLLIESADQIACAEPVTAHLEDENGKMTVFSREDGSLTFYLSIGNGKECCRLRISKDYCQAEAWIGGTVAERRYALDTALMLLYTFSSSNRYTLLIHASTVEYEGKGFIFLGKSGTGKSTHSRLWMENVRGSELLNDDNPIIRIIDGKIYVCGSPWSGKTPCYRNRMIPVGGIVRLYQSSVNEIFPLTGIKAYAALLPSCSCMKWNQEMAESVHTTISCVLKSVPVYSLGCLPNREAALLCCKMILK